MSILACFYTVTVFIHVKGLPKMVASTLYNMADGNRRIHEKTYADLNKDHNEIMTRNEKIKCLQHADCNQIGQRCCHTFLDPESKCFQECPSGWHEVIKKLDKENRGSNLKTKYKEHSKKLIAPPKNSYKSNTVRKMSF